MISKWFELKPHAIELRRSGMSLRDVEKTLGIPRSTLSGWFKDIKLKAKAQYRLTENRLKHLAKARKNAVLWHNQQRLRRMEDAEKQAVEVLPHLDTRNKSLLELALAMLYLGEGNKISSTCLGSSNPLILNFFISSLRKIYSFDTNKIRCDLHLRADQDPDQMKTYWSKQLNIPISNFTSVSIDKRTLGSTTYSTYKGVCVLYCGNIALQRRLMYLSQKFCENIIKGS